MCYFNSPFDHLLTFKLVYCTLPGEEFYTQVIQSYRFEHLMIPRKKRRSYLYKFANKLMHQNCNFLQYQAPPDHMNKIKKSYLLHFRVT